MTEENRQGNSEGENGSSQRTWTVEIFQRPRKPTSLPVDVPVRQLDESDNDDEDKNTVQTLESCSELSDSLSEEMILKYAIPPLLIDMAKNIYIDDDMPVMVNKVYIPERDTCRVDYRRFLEEYVPKMNESARKLKEQKFSHVKEAYLVLSQMVRSFSSNITVHMGRNRGNKAFFTCSTENHKKRLLKKGTLKTGQLKRG